jgi:hypothetical protein
MDAVEALRKQLDGAGIDVVRELVKVFADALSHGRGEAAGHYFTLAVLSSFSGLLGEKLVGEAGVARGVGIMHSIGEAMLNCAQRGCGTYDPRPIVDSENPSAAF